MCRVLARQVEFFRAYRNFSHLVLAVGSLEEMEKVFGLIVSNKPYEAVEGGGRAGGASNGDVQDGAWGGVFRHADQHDQSRIHA